MMVSSSSVHFIWELKEITTESCPDVVLLSHLGVAPQDVTLLSGQDILLHALANMSSKGGYADQHCATFACDLGNNQHHYFMAAFPHLFLFPYGIGGPWAEWWRLNFIDHIWWYLKYHDQCFWTEHSFPFITFSISQKQECLSSAWIQMTHKDFEADLDLLSRLTLGDLKVAAEEDIQKKGITDPTVWSLMRHLKVTAGKVIRTNQSWASIHSKIWSQSINLDLQYCGWLLNPSDLHVPIVQVFFREEINLNAFEWTAGPNLNHWMENLAQDPYVAV